MKTAIAVYQETMPGALEPLLREHAQLLRAERLLSSRPGLVLKAPGGFYLEIVGWASAEASARAHENPRVRALWDKLAGAARFCSIGELPAECLSVPFAKFDIFC